MTLGKKRGQVPPVLPPGYTPEQCLHNIFNPRHMREGYGSCSVCVCVCVCVCLSVCLLPR